MNERNGTTTLDAATEGRIDHLKDSVKGFVDQSQEKVDAIRSRVVDVKDKAVKNGGEYLDKGADFIKANPLKAVAVAFGLGYIGMRIFR